MSILEFPSVKIHTDNTEELWQKIVDNYFDKWRDEFEQQKGIKIDDLSYLSITNFVWNDVTEIMLWIVEEDFHWESEWYILSLVKQKVEAYRERVMLILEEWVKDEEKDVKSNVVNLFGRGK